MQKLSTNFIHEILKLSLTNKKFLSVLSEYLKYEHIPKEFQELKKIWKSIKTTFVNQNKIITIGVLSQQFETDVKVQEEIEKIQSIKTSELNQDLLLDEFEKYIKDIDFQLMNMKVISLYEDKREEEAMKFCREESERIVNLSIKENSLYYLRAFEDFDEIMERRQDEYEERGEKLDKIPFFIDELDAMTHGGMDAGDTALLALRSGIGKSTWAVYMGYKAAVELGKKVLHIQLEGTREEAWDRYNRAWTKEKLYNIKKGEIRKENKEKIRKFLRSMKTKKRDINIYSSETFDEVSMLDVRKITFEFKKIHGQFPDLILVDSLDLCHPGDGLKYGFDVQSIKMKKQNTAKKMKNLTNEIGSCLVTVDQINGAQKEKWDDPDFVFDRSMISGDRNLANAFSFVFTGNQTLEEEKKGMLRIFVDKFRNYKIENRIVKIYTDLDNGRFYNPKKTRSSILDL